MLKKLLSTSLLVALGIVVSPAQANIESSLSNICDIVKTNDKSELRRKMRNVENDYGAKLRDYYSGITCSGTSLIKLAILNDANDAGTLLVKKMPKKALRQEEHDGSSLKAWIDEQGLQDNPVSKALMERI